jgi:hypothetical protein
VTSHLNDRFRRHFAKLPNRIKKQARQSYRRFKSDPAHPSLEFKKLPPFDDIWSVRVTRAYRAVGQREGDRIVWFFIGTHAEYDMLLENL